MAPPSLSTMLMSITPKASSDNFVSAAGLRPRNDSDFQKKFLSSVLDTDENIDTGSPLPVAQSGGPTSQQDGTMGQGEVKKLLTYEEILRRKNEGETLIVVNGNVYNVTEFLETHPGGAELILEHLKPEGVNEAGPLMRGKGDEDGHSHSKAAFRILEQYFVGSVKAGPGAAQSEAQEAKKYRFTVDLTKPIVAQVGYLGPDYDEWVHDSIIRKESPRFFESDFLEFFTQTKWWVVPLVWLPVGMIMLYMSVVIEKLPLHMLPGVFVFGVILWTLEEYLLHRFLFHMKTSSYWGNTMHYVIHGFHHKHPMDGCRLVFPPAFTLVIVIALWFITGNVVSYPSKLCIFASGLFSYVCYDLTHYFLHFGTAFNNKTRKLKRYHLNHHFKDPANGYGITTTMWDSLFRTQPASEISVD